LVTPIDSIFLEADNIMIFCGLVLTDRIFLWCGGHTMELLYRSHSKNATVSMQKNHIYTFVAKKQQKLHGFLG